MVFDWTNVGTPFSWCFVAALLLGAAVARVARRDWGRERWALVYLYLAISVACVTAGVLIPGAERFLDPRLAYFGAGVVVASFLAFRYKAAFGMPLLLIVAAVLVLFSIGLRGWLPLRGESVGLARVQILGIEGGRADLEVTPNSGGRANSSVTGTLPAGPVAPVVDVLTFSPDYFFFASPALCRLEGLAALSGGTRRADLALPAIAPVRAAFFARLPGVRLRTVVGEATEPAPLQEYVVRISSGLTAQLTTAPPQAASP